MEEGKSTTKYLSGLPLSLTTWIINLGALALILIACYKAFTGGVEISGLIDSLLLNAGLFLGIQRAGSIASLISEKREETKVQVAHVQAINPTPQIDVNVQSSKVDVGSMPAAPTVVTTGDVVDPKNTYTPEMDKNQGM